VGDTPLQSCEQRSPSCDPATDSSTTQTMHPSEADITLLVIYYIIGEKETWPNKITLRTILLIIAMTLDNFLVELCPWGLFLYRQIQDFGEGVHIYAKTIVDPSYFHQLAIFN